MSTINERDNMEDNLEHPVYDWEMLAAAGDPLTPEPVLLRIYERNTSELLKKLAMNPALPRDILDAMVKSNQAVLGSSLVRNPQLSLDDIKILVQVSIKIEPLFLTGFSSVLEIFDWLMVEDHYLISCRFAAALLRSSGATKLEYTKRLGLYYNVLDSPNLLEDSRFNPSTLMPPYERNSVNAIMANPSISRELLLMIADPYITGRSLDSRAVKNLVYPIEFSAHYHIENIESYKWTPTYRIALEAKVNERLTFLSKKTSWEDIPLLWKLKILAE